MIFAFFVCPSVAVNSQPTSTLIAYTPTDSSVCVAGLLDLRLCFSRRVSHTYRWHTWDGTETWLVHAHLNGLARKLSPCFWDLRVKAFALSWRYDPNAIPMHAAEHALGMMLRWKKCLNVLFLYFAMILARQDASPALITCLSALRQR